MISSESPKVTHEGHSYYWAWPSIRCPQSPKHQTWKVWMLAQTDDQNQKKW